MEISLNRARDTPWSGRELILQQSADSVGQGIDASTPIRSTHITGDYSQTIGLVTIDSNVAAKKNRRAVYVCIICTFWGPTTNLL